MAGIVRLEKANFQILVFHHPHKEFFGISNIKVVLVSAACDQKALNQNLLKDFQL
jgi:hypothetical protein